MKTICASVILGLLIIVQAGCGKNFQSISSSEVTINGVANYKLKVSNKSFDEILKFLRGKTTIPISIDNNVDTVRKITGTFQDKSWDLILKKVCAHLGYMMEEKVDELGNITSIQIIHNKPDAGDGL